MLFKTLALALLAVGLVQGETIYEHVADHADEDLATLKKALDATGLDATLADETAGPFTLFAPVDTVRHEAESRVKCVLAVMSGLGVLGACRPLLPSLTVFLKSCCARKT